jgi:hypothetical protein
MVRSKKREGHFEGEAPFSKQKKLDTFQILRQSSFFEHPKEHTTRIHAMGKRLFENSV